MAGSWQAMAGQSEIDSTKQLPVAQGDDSAARLVQSRAFERGINALIVVSAVLMGLQADLSVKPAYDYLDWVWDACEMIMAVIFFAEMALKLKVYRLSYFRDQWNWLDFFVSWISALSVFVVPAAQEMAASVGDMDIARIFRLMRLMRMMKMMKAIPELMMVMEGLVASMKSMVWVFVLLFLILYVMSIYCVEMIGRENSGAYPAFERNLTKIKESSEHFQTFNNYESFGNILRGMLTLFSMTLVAEWSEVIRPVFEAQQVHIPVFVSLIFFTSFGIINVIIGVICEKTNESMRRMEQEGIQLHHQEQNGMVRSLSELMFDMDKDGDGSISKVEFSAAGTGDLKEKFEEVHLPLGFTFEDLFTMLDVDGSDELSRDEFVNGMQRLISGNEFQLNCTSQLMMGKIKHNIFQMKNDLDSLRQQVRILKGALRAGRGGGSPAASQSPLELATGGGDDGSLHGRAGAAEPGEELGQEPDAEGGDALRGPSLSDRSPHSTARPRDREALGLAVQQAGRDREEAELFLGRVREERGRVRSEQLQLEAERGSSAEAVIRELREERRLVEAERRQLHRQHQETLRKLEEVRHDESKADVQWQRVLRERDQLSAAQARLEPLR